MLSEESSNWDSDEKSSTTLSTIQENVSNKSIKSISKPLEQICDVIDENQVSNEQLVFTYTYTPLLLKV